MKKFNYVFAARMRFEIARHHAHDVAVRGLGDEMLRLPAGARHRRVRCLERQQEGMAGKRIGTQLAGAGVPCGIGDLADGRKHADAQRLAGSRIPATDILRRGGVCILWAGLAGHAQARNPSKIIWSA